MRKSRSATAGRARGRRRAVGSRARASARLGQSTGLPRRHSSNGGCEVPNPPKKPKESGTSRAAPSAAFRLPNFPSYRPNAISITRHVGVAMQREKGLKSAKACMGWLFVHAKRALTRRPAGGLSRWIGRNSPTRTALTPWAIGLVVAVVILGPALKPGSLLNLDLVFTPRMPVPRGIWGLGPELSRRIPLGVLVAWASVVVGGPLVGKALLLASVTFAFAGVWRLAADTPFVCRVGAGLLYAASPFTLTRIGVGHWTLVAALALLPWALPALVRPGDDLRRTWLWSVALGLTGITGGMFAAILLGAGLVADRGRRMLVVLGVFVVAQLPWLIPGAFSVASVGHLSNGRHFATHTALPMGLLRLVVG